MRTHTPSGGHLGGLCRRRPGRQADPALQNREPAPTEVPVTRVMETWTWLARSSTTIPPTWPWGRGQEPCPRTGGAAVIEERLPVREWPSRKLLITAANVLTGEFRESGVSLVDAVTASCTVPMI
ncbi:hypothetical protein [Actinomadura rubrisoli]|uniref:Uncharacterized protein n=1 Tax=Actinomadura rubrisoli TaxID=2530368 RepID=A0A4R4ZVW2_9ACTN|nr:hypothetical protein [Actinomadura rubrisoli]TDD63331.1 hypothetical protein E1298_43945 [Actinomadura rubrisoli]